jgi:hypothetical protein
MAGLAGAPGRQARLLAAVGSNAGAVGACAGTDFPQNCHTAGMMVSETMRNQHMMGRPSFQ